jgi:membrane fusion protein (multidrug efflux system)
MDVQVKPEEPVGGTHKAKVTVVDHVVDAGSGTLGIRMELPNPDLRIPAGLKCTVRFPQKPEKNGVATDSTITNKDR